MDKKKANLPSFAENRVDLSGAGGERGIPCQFRERKIEASQKKESGLTYGRRSRKHRGTSSLRDKEDIEKRRIHEKKGRRALQKWDGGKPSSVESEGCALRRARKSQAITTEKKGPGR